MSADVEIVLGAKDQASKILRDVSSGTREMGRNIKSMAAQSTQATSRVESGFQSLKAAAGPLIAAFAAFKAVTAGFAVIGDSAEAFDVQQESVRGLTKAIELSGSATGPTIDQHKAFASELQNVANVGDEVTLGLMKQASMLGISNDDLQEATRAAVGLSEATGISLDDALKKVNGALNGNAGALQEYLPALKNATTEEEKLAIVLAASEKGLAQKADRANTAAGSAERLSNTWGDFLEVIGGALAPVRQFINEGLTALIEVIQSSVIPALNSIMPSAETVANAMAMMKTGIITAVSVAEVVVGNLGTIWELAKVSVQYSVTSMVNDIKYQFTTVIPEYIKWFGDNFFNLIRDAFTAAVTIVKNRMIQMGDIIKRLWDFVVSGFSGGFGSVINDIADIANRNLLEGFEATTQALPQIAARAMTNGEAEMVGTMGQLAGKLGDAYRTTLAERMKSAADDSGAAMLDSIKLTTSAAGEEIKKTKGSAASSLTASEGRLQTRGRAEQFQEKIAANTARANKILETIAVKVESGPMPGPTDAMVMEMIG